MNQRRRWTIGGAGGWGVVMAALVACVAVGAAAVEEDPGLYKVLGIEEDATERQIKLAYREQSRLYHPDVNRSPEARDKLVWINKANDVLSDRKKRKMYDIRGMEGLKLLERNGQQQQMHDPFMAMFGGGGGGGGGGARGQDMRTNVELSLSDIYNGRTHTLTVSKQLVCRKCKGSGAASNSDYKTCSHCKGKGVTVQRIQLAPGFVQQVQNACPHCGGSGKEVKNNCPACKGKKVLRGEGKLELVVERGVPEDHEVRFDMEADQSPDAVPGDVVIIIKSKADSAFRRSGNDLHLTVKLTLKEALLGFAKSVTHMDGHAFTISRSGVTQHGTVEVVSGEGMPIHKHPAGAHGDLYVTYEFESPRTLTTAMRETMEELF